MKTVTNDSLRSLERSSLRRFVESCREELDGLTLDLGCGQQPYRDVVEQAGGEYVGFDRSHFGGNVGGDRGPHAPLAKYDHYDAVLLNQVLQYVWRPLELLVSIRFALRPCGALVLTSGLTWPEVEQADLCRYTRAGLERLLDTAGLKVERLESRASLPFDGFELSLGYGVLARKP